MIEKKSKASVNYSLGGDHCGACTHFINENEATETGECELVEGAIKEDFWCKLFSRKKKQSRVFTSSRLKAGGTL